LHAMETKQQFKEHNCYNKTLCENVEKKTGNTKNEEQLKRQ